MPRMLPATGRSTETEGGVVSVVATWTESLLARPKASVTWRTYVVVPRGGRTTVHAPFAMRTVPWYQA